MTVSKEKRGFTLVEMLIVMAILAVLIGISVAGIRFALRRSRNTARLATMENMETAIEAFNADFQSYPDDQYPSSMVGLGDTPSEDLVEFLEGKFEVPANDTMVYYDVDGNGFSYYLCISQETGLTPPDYDYRCTGPAVGDTDFEGAPSSSEEEGPPGTENCTTFSLDANGDLDFDNSCDGE